jgi:hypothetical protein
VIVLSYTRNGREQAMATKENFQNLKPDVIAKTRLYSDNSQSFTVLHGVTMEAARYHLSVNEKLGGKPARSMLFRKICDFTCFDDNLGRAYMPQPWAKGILPIFPKKWMVSFANGSKIDLSYTVRPGSKRQIVGYSYALVRQITTGGIGISKLTKILLEVGYSGLTVGDVMAAVKSRPDLFAPHKGLSQWTVKRAYDAEPILEGDAVAQTNKTLLKVFRLLRDK